MSNIKLLIFNIYYIQAKLKGYKRYTYYTLNI